VRVRRQVGTASAAALLAAALSACSGSAYDSGGGKGFVSGDGSVSVVDRADRERPLAEVAGESVTGGAVSLSELRGKVVVMPVWGSWCGPCRAEAPALAEAARDLEDDGVVFLGINSRDPAKDAAAAFVRNFALPYDSIYDPDGETLLAFHGTLPPNSIPSFVVIDPQGRIAGRILGPATTATVYGVVEDVLGREVSS
jgi:thiol-disulfide isomerase/thioredoxin